MDLEGIIGVTDLRKKSQNERLLVRQLKNTVECIKKYSSGSIVACLIHDNGSMNLEVFFREEKIKIAYGIEAFKEISADYALLIGFHSKSGGKGRFPHSFRTEINKITVENKEVGEVFLFSDYLEKRGTKVIFASGEGDFEDELRAFNARIYTGSDEEEYVKIIGRTLSTTCDGVRKPSTEDRMVRVYMNNTDYYEYLKGRFNISDGCIEFPSTEFFFENIIDLCIWINKAKGEIHNKNAQIVDILREYRDLEIIKRIGDEYLRKDIELFCEFDRERIKELISYEKKTY